MSKVTIDMHERRADPEATVGSRDSKTSNRRGHSLGQTSEAAVGERLDLQWGSESAMSESSSRPRGAQQILSTRGVPRAMSSARVLRIARIGRQCAARLIDAAKYANRSFP